MTRLAILDDEERMAEVLAMVLRRAGHEVVTHHHPRALLEALDDESYDLLLTDLKMPDIDGLEVLRRVKARFPEMPVVLLTAHGTVSTAVAAMKEGAYDYLEKPVDNDACRAVVARALELTRLSRENRYLRRHVRQELGLHEIVAESDAMKRVLDLVARAARSTATVVVSGESGTGKEVVARAIHVESDRVAEPFLAVNCKAFASGVLESELFGHEKGAFTGAQSARAGVFERAEGGTLFLDEIGEVGDDFQAKLLRVVQEREVQRVGADQAKPFDVRIVS
ncbi:MAG: sigma-54 dependent transcriptional regulator, partial [Polyangiaceae bacterium]